MLKNIIGAVVIGLIMLFVQNYFKDVPTATYIVSEAIEIVGSQGKSEYAQEIVVANPGHSALKDISIKVPRHISSFKLTKHSSLIQEKTFQGDNSFELVYPDLPSGQKIRLQIRYDGIPMDKSWISISHADGVAQPQENQTPAINFLWIWLAFCAGILSQSVSAIRSWKRESFSKWATNEEPFRNNKPWFSTSAEWSEMQYESIRRTLNNSSYYASIDSSAHYQLLNRSKPTLLSEEHWTKLQKQATESLMSNFSKMVTRYSSPDKLVDLFKLKKPEALPIESWTEFQKSLISQLKSNLLPAGMKPTDYVNILDPNNLMLKILPDQVASEIRDLAQKYYSEYLTSRSAWETESDSLTVLKSARLDLLTSDQAASVKKKILRLARMAAMPSDWSIGKLELFISKERPEWMPEKEFNSLRELVTQSKSLSDERSALHQQERELKTAKLVAESLKKRVLAQLDLIDRVLSNPSSINKIEEYDSTFAPGNRKNLELVATLLNAQNQR